MSSRLLVLSAALAWLAACQPGPTIELGSLPDADTDQEHDEDAGIREPCREQSDCESEARPFCSEELERCVACTRDRHCNEGEYCRDRTGTCIEDR